MTSGRQPAGQESARVSVVICALNEERVIGEQLAALTAQNAGTSWEVVVVDNGSTDSTVARALEFEDRLPNLRVVDASARRGISYARNRGAGAARGALLLYLDADDEVGPGWLQAMVEAGSRVDAVCGNILEFHDGPGGTRTFAPDVHHDLPTRNYGFLPALFGGNFGIRTEVFKALGGFDERYDRVRSGEDTAFAWRVILSGYSLGFVPDAILLCRSRTRLKALFLQALRDGRSGPYLFRDFAAAGMPRSSSREAFRWWSSLPLRLIRERKAGNRRSRVQELGWRSGRIAASIRAHVIYL